MIFNSIKWRLQIWYGLILVAVLAGFGFTAYQLEWGRQMRRVDDELQRRFNLLANAIRPPPRGANEERQPLDDSSPDQRPEDLRGQNQRPPVGFHLPPQAAGLFDTNAPNNFYFVIKARDGREIARSSNTPSLADLYRNFSEHDPFDPNAPPEQHVNSPKPPSLETLLGFREMIQKLPPGETILVGCSIMPELRELRLTALKLAGVGGIILLFGLAGGWWLVSRAIRPIEDISATAVKISAGDLSQRINVAETESELGKLASVLNSTFARLDAAFAQQKQFASDAAHELRTPVSVILTQTQTALNREREAADYKQTVEACQRAAQRMRKLIGSLLELTRLDAGQEQMKRLPFDLSKTVADCVALIHPLADERGVKVFTELSPLKLSGDSERLGQVVTNLLTNAIQYNRDGGEVRVHLKSENGMAILTVNDTGRGIPPDDLSHIFDRFHRADKSRTGANAGLGLAISKAIVAAHSGTIDVVSQEDIGTTFTVRLPL